MFASMWIYEIMLLIYSISLIGYFVDFIKTNSRVNKISFYLLCIVLTIQTMILVNQTFIEKSFPILTLNEGLFFYAWILIIFSLLMNYFFKIYFIIFFTNVFSFFILLLAVSLSANTVFPGQENVFVHEILIIHITLSLFSYVFFTLSFILSSLYLIQYFFLKEKKGLRWMWRFSDLGKLDHYSFLSIIIGVPLLLIGLLFGFVWAYVAHEEFYLFDVKIIGSILVLFVYIIYLLLRIIRGYRGRPISLYNSCAFLFLLINYFLLSSLSNFHF